MMSLYDKQLPDSTRSRSIDLLEVCLSDKLVKWMMIFFNEQVVRKDDKIGRNDPCPCGSGKKYKKCCLVTQATAARMYITAHDSNFQKKKNDVKAFSLAEIRDLSLSELQSLNIKQMSKAQLLMVLRISSDNTDFKLALSSLFEIRKFYTETNVVLPGKEEVIKLHNRKIIMPIRDDLFDNKIMELVGEIEFSNRFDLMPKI